MRGIKSAFFLCSPTLRAESGSSLQVRGLWGNLAKAAVQQDVKSTDAANDLVAAVSPIGHFFESKYYNKKSVR